MSSDLLNLLHRAAPEPAEAPDTARLWKAGRRRRRYRRFGASLAALVFAIGLAAVVVNSRGQTETGDAVATADTTLTETDSTHRFTVEYPATWHRAATTLTPALRDPVEILTLGTGELPAGGNSCAQFPTAALEAFRSTDALVTVHERVLDLEGVADAFPPRPQQFPPDGSENISEVVDCLDQPLTFDSWQFEFLASGRAFHVFAAIGTDASEQTRAEIWQILESLEFDPR